MLISSLNSAAFADTLILITAADTANNQATKQQGDVVRIYDETTDQTLGYNIFHISQYLPGLTGNGQVFLSGAQVSQLNQLLTTNGFAADLAADLSPKFVIGYVKTLTPHPDSDHLSVTEVDVDHGQTLQIVCGAPNVAQGQKVVVAKVGAMMPNGQIIWPGALRGVTSDGMISAARELALPNAPKKHGILVMPADIPAGTPFDFDQAAKVVAAQNAAE
ncbi:YtpR family tRNA-binding protein [Loigolactobacillus jiayinensis]|uniref:YtpR family tRNA-binding protein n=1 Tax=Loigolactobacillus jiayinensis TaxID=2486016 RepID=A0ABW1RDP1_9LACO|nr:DUF4479 and tRNA-binding domain-containing protein [Loigolactobacillus jiayinensis]